MKTKKAPKPSSRILDRSSKNFDPVSQKLLISQDRGFFRNDVLGVFQTFLIWHLKLKKQYGLANHIRFMVLMVCERHKFCCVKAKKLEIFHISGLQ